MQDQQSAPLTSCVQAGSALPTNNNACPAGNAALPAPTPMRPVSIGNTCIKQGMSACQPTQWPKKAGNLT